MTKQVVRSLVVDNLLPLGIIILVARWGNRHFGVGDVFIMVSAWSVTRWAMWWMRQQKQLRQLPPSDGWGGSSDHPRRERRG